MKKMMSGAVMFVIVVLVGNIDSINIVLRLGLQIFIGVTVYILLLVVVKDRWFINFVYNNFLSKVKKT